MTPPSSPLSGASAPPRSTPLRSVKSIRSSTSRTPLSSKSLSTSITGRQIAADRYPSGLPEPYSDDPTQWIFHGDTCRSVVWNKETKRTDHGPLRTDATVLQVAVARLLGYRWPAELDPAMHLAPEQRYVADDCRAFDEFADPDGIVCLSAAHRESNAADRLRRLARARLR